MAHYRTSTASPVTAGSTLIHGGDRLGTHHLAPLPWGTGCPLSLPTPLPTQPISHWELLLGDG